MIKILATTTVIFTLTTIILWFLYSYYLEKFNASEIALKSITLEIDKYNKSQDEATKTIIEIKEKIQYVEKDCNCYNARIDDTIIDSVRGNSTKQ